MELPLFRAMLILILSLFSLYATQNNSYAEIKPEVEKRWLIFQTDKEFKEFRPGISDSELEKEFEEIRKMRFSMWATAEYAVAEHLVTEDLVRAPGCTAFPFNNTVPLL